MEPLRGGFAREGFPDVTVCAWSRDRARYLSFFAGESGMVHRVFLTAVAAFALVAGSWLLAQDTKPTTKGGRSLPPNWGKLGLSDDQKKEVYAIRGKYSVQIAQLEAQIQMLRKKEQTELTKVLTDDQKARLKEILTSKIRDDSGSDKAKDKDKK
jgi:hypothetical protein